MKIKKQLALCTALWILCTAFSACGKIKLEVPEDTTAIEKFVEETSAEIIADEMLERKGWSISALFTDKDNCIYVNGNEPTFLYTVGYKHAHIMEYTESNDKTGTYNCYTKTPERSNEDLYFSFTLNTNEKLCEETDDSELCIFSNIYY